MKEFTIFWGCTIQTRFPFIEKSVRNVLEGFGLPYRDIDGFTCCPEKSLVNNVDSGLWKITAARNIAAAEGEGVDVLSPCTGCASNLSTVKSELNAMPAEKAQTNRILKSIGREFKGNAAIRHIVPFFHDEVGIHKIKSRIKKPFNGMRFAVHYGCHMMRPSHALKNDDPLSPKKFDTLIAALGGESINYSTKLMCCGQSLDRIDEHDKALLMARIKLGEVKKLGADAMVLACPSCFLQFDNNQNLMEKEGERFSIPVLYLTDILGLAMGYTVEDLGITLHRMDVEPFLKKWEEAQSRKTPEIFLKEGFMMEGALS